MLRAGGRTEPPLLAWLALGVSGALVAGCEPPEEEVRAPEVAEIQREEPAEPVELDFEEAYPMTPDDVGDPMLASGTVVGTPGPEGFFVRAEGNHVIFVQSAQQVTPGQRVRAVGPLHAAEAVVFQGWEDSLLGEPSPEWELVRDYYIRATSVTPLS